PRRASRLEGRRRLGGPVAVGYPGLLATSRKRMIKELMDEEAPAHGRDEATAATTIHGIDKGVAGVRVHNIALNRKLSDAYVRLRRTSMDNIRLNGIKTYAYHGVFDAERKLGQFFVTDVVMYLDLSAASK